MERRISFLAALYFVIGLLFAVGYALFYHWPTLGYLSPGFYMVILTWPFQAVGFVPDFLQHGFAGKPIEL